MSSSPLHDPPHGSACDDVIWMQYSEFKYIILAQDDAFEDFQFVSLINLQVLFSFCKQKIFESGHLLRHCFDSWQSLLNRVVNPIDLIDVNDFESLIQPRKAEVRIFKWISLFVSVLITFSCVWLIFGAKRPRVSIIKTKCEFFVLTIIRGSCCCVWSVKVAEPVKMI